MLDTYRCPVLGKYLFFVFFTSRGTLFNIGEFGVTNGNVLGGVFFSLSELLRSHWYLYWGNIAYKQEAYSLSGENFFMSETENSCSRLCHPFFSRQKIPKSCNQRSLHLIDKATNKPKCLSTSTAACQTSSIATRCPV